MLASLNNAAMLGLSLLAHIASSTDDSSVSVVENKQTSDSTWLQVQKHIKHKLPSDDSSVSQWEI